jgi:hypothetical protein
VSSLRAGDIFGAKVNGRHLHLTPASAICVRPARWLWQGRIPLGALSLIGGREGIGKSTYAYTTAAQVTRGHLPGIWAGTARDVIIAATEDSWEYKIVPALMAAGADLCRVHRVDVTTADGADATLSLPRDLDELQRVIVEVQAVLVLLDPIMSRLDGALDTHKDAEVRRALEPLVTLAATTDVAIIGILHVNKTTSTDALTMLMGSRAFVAVARAVLFIMVDPDDEQTRLLGQPKNNYGRMDLPTLKFTITEVAVAETLEGPVTTGKLVWAGETDRTIREALEAVAETTGDKTATTEALGWLHDYLSANDGSAESAAVKREGAKQGHSKDALRRASKRLGVAIITTGFPRRSTWKLPVNATQGSASSTAPTAPTAPTGETSGSKNNQLASVDAVSAVDALSCDVAPTVPEDTDSGSREDVSLERF